MSALLDHLLTCEPQFRKQRLPSLYSDFRLQKSTNPDGYVANVAAWEDGLEHAAAAGLLPKEDGRLSLRTGEELLLALETREWGRPLAVGAVVEEAVMTGRMIPLDTYVAATSSILDPQNGIQLQPWRVLSWALKQIFGTGHASTSHLQRGQYVLIRNVMEAGDKVMKRMSDRVSTVDKIIPMKTFKEEVAQALGLDGNMTSNDLGILLKFLARDMCYIAYNSEIVKLKGLQEDAPTLTAQDSDIVFLKGLIMDLEVQLDIISFKINEISNKARLAVINNNKVLALSSLRLKKLHEAQFSRRSETLAQLQDVYSKIKEAADQVAVIKAMQTSTEILRGMNSEVGSVNTVGAVFQRLRDEVVKADDIGSVINEASQGASAIDESAVDDEFEEMEREALKKSEEKGASETRKRLEDLKLAHSSQASQPGHEAISTRDASISTLESPQGKPVGVVAGESMNAQSGMSLDRNEVSTTQEELLMNT